MPLFPYPAVSGFEALARFLEDLSNDRVLSFSPTRLEYYGGVLTGTDLEAESLEDSRSRLLGGTITGITGLDLLPFQQGFKLTGLSIRALDLDAARVKVWSGADPLAVQRLFWGEDWTFEGSHGKDVVSCGGVTGSNRIEGKGGDDLIDGGRGSDTIFGGEGYDHIQGGDGDDRLYAGADGANLLGGKGADHLYSRGHGEIDGGAGDDRIQVTAPGRFFLIAHGREGDDVFVSTVGEGTFFGGDGFDSLVGGAGGETVHGENGNDTLHGGGGSDRLLGGEGRDTLRGGERADRLNGGQGGDTLLGNVGDDELRGGDGDDRLRGGFGADWLEGGGGDDAFVFESRWTAGDAIADFHAAQGDDDLFRIDAESFGGGLRAGAALSPSRFKAADESLLVGEGEQGVRFVWERDATKLWFDGNGSDKGGLILVANLQAGAVVTASDILLV